MAGTGRGTTFVTAQQAAVYERYLQMRSMSDVGRALGLSQIRVREALVQHQRNRMRDAGLRPPPLREMLRGDVTTRFGVSREEANGRPAKHLQCDPVISGVVGPHTPPKDVPLVHRSSNGLQRFVVTSVEPGLPVHEGFWRNLRAYAAYTAASVIVLRLGSSDVVDRASRPWGSMLVAERIDVGGVIDVAGDLAVPLRLARPLESVSHRNKAKWTLVGHPVVQLETLPRIRSDGLRVQLSTGSINMPRQARVPGGSADLGAVIVEVRADGAAWCRHLLAEPAGDGSFQDLDRKAVAGVVTRGHSVEALHFGDIHHAHMNDDVAGSTWGLGRKTRDASSLVDRLRPKSMIFHDVCDFEARNPHDRRDHLKRFAQTTSGAGDVRAELQAAADFLSSTRRRWSSSVVVRSNHDDMLVRWLGETDFREDPINAVFFLETSLALHRRLIEGNGTDDMFEHTLRRLSKSGLRGVRFLRTGESFRVAGVESAVHGHQGADGKRGDIRFFERLGVPMTMGHMHRPTTRDGICCTGVCQPDLAYARGPLTAWAIAHVVTYETGARQHLFFDGGAFHA